MKPSFTKEDQVKHLSEKWHVEPDRARQMILDVRNMNAAALLRGDRLYIDDFGTFTVQIKPKTQKRLPGQSTKTLIGARVNVKFEESETLRTELTQAFQGKINEANSR